MKNSVSKRIRITKTGKLMRRAMVLGHSRANKSTTQMKRKKVMRGLAVQKSFIKAFV